MKHLEVILSERLPDINRYSQLNAKFDDYGRIAIDSNDNIVVMGIRSSHPSNTKEGFYWATSGNKLFISPRGAAYEWEKFITDDFIRTVVKDLKLHRKFKYFKLIR